MNIKNNFWTEKKEIILFIFVTFIITWGIEIPAALASHGYLNITIPGTLNKIATFAPGIVALVLTVLTNGWKGFKKFLASIVRFKVGLKWYAIALLTGTFISALAVGIYSMIWKVQPNIAPLYNLFFYLLLFFFFSPLWEEVGWRGYLLPRMLNNFSPLKSSLIIGFIWGLWHLPIFLVENVNGDKTLLFTALIFISCFPLSILLTWLYIRTRGSVFLCILFHDGINSGIGYFMGNTRNNDMRPLEITTGLLMLLAMFIYSNNKPVFRLISDRPRL